MIDLLEALQQDRPQEEIKHSSPVINNMIKLADKTFEVEYSSQFQDLNLQRWTPVKK